MKNTINTVANDFSEAISNANINDEASMKNLFNRVATKEYLENTTKTFEELQNFDCTNWADGLNGGEWESVKQCMLCAEIAAQELLEEEAQQD